MNRETQRKANLMLLLFCLPALTVYIIFKLFPAISGFYYSLTNWNGLNPTFDFVGFANYQKMASDSDFWRSLGFTAKYVAAFVILANAMALILAVAIESRRHLRGALRTIFYMPNMISMVIGGYMWMFIFTKVVYYLADNWHWTFLDHSWTGDPNYSFWSILIVSCWGAVGYLMIIYIAGLQGVPSDLKEASKLDGCNSFQTFWYMIRPLIRPAATICVFWTLNSGFQVFDVIYTLTGGGPGTATQSVAINIYEEAFKGNTRFGYSTAKSMVLFLVVLLVTLVQLSIMQKQEEDL